MTPLVVDSQPVISYGRRKQRRRWVPDRPAPAQPQDPARDVLREIAAFDRAEPRSPTDVTCAKCGKGFMARGRRGPIPRYCSGACRKAAWDARHATLAAEGNDPADG